MIEEEALTEKNRTGKGYSDRSIILSQGLPDVSVLQPCHSNLKEMLHHFLHICHLSRVSKHILCWVALQLVRQGLCSIPQIGHFQSDWLLIQPSFASSKVPPVICKIGHCFTRHSCNGYAFWYQNACDDISAVLNASCRSLLRNSIVFGSHNFETISLWPLSKLSKKVGKNLTQYSICHSRGCTWKINLVYFVPSSSRCSWSS